MISNRLNPTASSKLVELESRLEECWPGMMEYLHSVAVLEANGVSVEAKIGLDMYSKVKELRSMLQIDFTN